jgi:hypothetical protein
MVGFKGWQVLKFQPNSFGLVDHFTNISGTKNDIL